ncbi:MAG: hypothetical protein IJZ19_04080 [Lentisphaeria bacterium]|nr:hypothetical protein [Lentisphaeria bacterium]
MLQNRSGQSGQVLLIGVVMCIILLVAVFILADVHNTIRAKLKLETAQQAAALAAAEWQRESLNLIGEINLIKASDALLCPPEQLDFMQQSYDRLTEMQSRVSFLGPLIGFAAAQQTAKANGINSHTDLSQLYLNQLTEDNEFYFPPDSDGYINNYKWFPPYKSLVETISQNGIAVRPNASNAFGLTAYPYCLNSTAFYREILFHYNDISKKPSYQMSWNGALVTMCKKPDSYYNAVWWDVQFHSAAFLGQSEIYSLYVKREDEIDHNSEEIQEHLQHSPVGMNLLPSTEERPDLRNVELKWFCYDLPNWDVAAYREKYMKEEDYHHQNWFGTEYVLRSSTKEQFQYEGPVAYAETGLRLSHLSHYIRPKSYGEKQKGTNLFKTNTPVDSSTVIGSTRVVNATKEIDLRERPGAIAKTFGKLRNEKPPHSVRMVLPVFYTTSIVPTHLPRPYDFGVLHELSDLERFLIWLSKQDSLSGTPPPNTDWMLKALQVLSDGPGFRYYCWNPNFNVDEFNNTWRDKWHEYYELRNFSPQKYVYDQEQNPTGPGWLQEPRYYGPIRQKEIRRKEVQTAQCTIHEGRTVTLVGIARNSFYVIDHTGKIITNEDPDPIREYYGNTFQGTEGSNDFGVPNQYNDKPGVSRL